MKFLIEILLVIIAGAIIFFILILKVRPSLISNSISKFGYELYQIIEGSKR